MSSISAPRSKFRLIRDSAREDRIDPLRGFAATLALIAAGCAALPWDTTISQWMRLHVHDDYWKPIKLAEAFAQAWGVAIIIIGIYVLVPARRIYLPRLAMTTFGAGIVTQLGKLVFARTRPRAFDPTGPIGESFLGWLPLWNDLYVKGKSSSDFQSMPSGHSASAVVFAVALSMNFPRGKWYFAALAGMACLQRVVEDAHYLSDVCWGAAVGMLTATLFTVEE